jgi:hypothetical protein
MANKILRSGQSRLILEAQLRAVVLRRMIADPKSKFIWSKAMAVFHLACEAYRIEQRLLRIPTRIALARAKKRINGRVLPPAVKERIIKSCKKCGVIYFNSASDHCEKHRRI